MLERYSTATRSTNLRADERHSAIDAVIAMGAADVVHGSLAVRTKYADHPQAAFELLDQLRIRCASRAKARGWPESVDPTRVADTAFDYWLNPACRSCTGAGEIGYRVCPDCQGGKTRPVTAQSQELQYVEDNVAYLNQVVSRTNRALADRLRSR